MREKALAGACMRARAYPVRLRPPPSSLIPPNDVAEKTVEYKTIDMESTVVWKSKLCGGEPVRLRDAPAASSGKSTARHGWASVGAELERLVPCTLPRRERRMGPRRSEERAQQRGFGEQPQPGWRGGRMTL